MGTSRLSAGQGVKSDKKLHGVQINWCGNVIRDGSGYYGEEGEKQKVETGKVETGAFPPPPPQGPDDVSRRRFSPSEKLKAEIGKVEIAPSAVTSVTYRDGAEVTPSAPKKPNALAAMWERLRADPVAMAAFLEKKKAGLARYLAKRKGK